VCDDTGDGERGDGVGLVGLPLLPLFPLLPCDRPVGLALAAGAALLDRGAAEGDGLHREDVLCGLGEGCWLAAGRAFCPPPF
jgi:hypothetical protein